MPIYNPGVGCAVCGEAIGFDRENILGFDMIEIPEQDFQRFADCLAHKSCLSKWERRDEFVAAWNRALGEYFVGKALVISPDGRVAYTDSDGWRIHHSPEVERRNNERWERSQAEAQRRRQELEGRIEAARAKAVEIGLGSARDVNRVIAEMGAEEFRREFGEFRVSRVFFKGAAKDSTGTGN